ncbi:EAL domain-containing protein [Thalassomonas haliotis]|uniref:sensor domain-containing phosphodiesterase n=1 Tax=Thalassomonas haliotis TaxID=485448 RepID=UPI002362F50B|nr:EAL domain-containing protein [Thalassomonas haliotis]
MPDLTLFKNEAQRLLALQALNILDTPPEERFDRITRIAMQVFDVPFAMVSLVDANRLWFKSSPGFYLTETSRSQSLCGYTILTDQVLMVEDTLLDRRSADKPWVVEAPHLRFYAGIAIKDNQGFNIGTLSILDHRPRTLTPEQIAILTELAKVAESEVNAADLSQVTAKLIQSKKQLHQAVAQLKQNEQLNRLRSQVLELIARSEPLAAILTAIVSGIELEYPEMMCSILLIDDSGTKLTLGAAPSMPDFYNQAVEGLEIGENVGSCGTSAYKGQRVVVEDIASHPSWAPYTELAARAQLGSCWSEPIVDPEGKVLGTFAIYHKEKSTPSARDFYLIEQSAALASISIERTRASKLIWQQANFDSLTGLTNRNLVRELLKTALKNSRRNQQKLALICLDLDHFKGVNDSLGHNIGDELLIECGKRLLNCTRESDTVARLGGDEFLILIPDLRDETLVEEIAGKILSALSQPFQLQQELIYVSASLGIAIFPDDAADLDDLLKNADQAMYGAKSSGRGCFHYFTPGMRASIQNRITLINDLRNAISNQELSLVYQPIFEISSQKIYKAEALLRWHHPSRGMISPTDFIPLAEESGLIIEIGDWVFEQACLQVAKWRRQYADNFQISINTSPLQYRSNTDSPADWLAWLAKHRLDAGALTLEITENLMMTDYDKINQRLAQLRQSGMEISIDDFGTGYSSLSYLKKFHIDYLKIDKSFVQKMSKDSDDLIICEAMVVMANKLGIKVIAEGIESTEQMQLLKDMGCQYGQGYWLAKPLTVEQFETLLGSNTRYKI